MLPLASAAVVASAALYNFAVSRDLAVALGLAVPEHSVRFATEPLAL